MKKLWKFGIVFIIVISIIISMVTKSAEYEIAKYEYIPASLPENFELPESRLIMLGTATHGNIEPFEITVQLLQEMKEKYGSVALLFEDNVGDVVMMNKNHSMRGPTSLQNSYAYGMGVYFTEEMEDLLKAVDDMDIRMYGFDTQEAKQTLVVLYERMNEFNFPLIEELRQAKYNKYSEEKEQKLLGDAKTYLENLLKNKKIFAKDYDFNVYLIDSIEMTRSLEHHEGMEASLQKDATEAAKAANYVRQRDQMMAQNVLWIMEHEKTYYGNTHCLLLAHNGHIIKNYTVSEEYKAAIGKEFGDEGETVYIDAFLKWTRMGEYLGEKLGKDCYAIITDAKYNSLYARDLNRWKIFSIEHTEDEINKYIPQNENVRFITSQELLEDGIYYWNMTHIGAVFSKEAQNIPESYIMPQDVTKSFDAILFFKQMTPSHML